VGEQRIMDKFRVRVQGTTFVRPLVGEEAEDECSNYVQLSCAGALVLYSEATDGNRW